MKLLEVEERHCPQNPVGMLQEREKERKLEREGSRKRERGRLLEDTVNVIPMLTQQKIQWPLVSHFVPFVLSKVHTDIVFRAVCVCEWKFVCICPAVHLF